MQVGVFNDESKIGEIGAEIIAPVFIDKPTGVLGLATGSSPLPLYDALVKKVETGVLSFAQAQAFCLDEYVGLSMEHPEAYRNFIRRVFTARTDFPDSAVHAPAGASDDPYAAAAEYDAQIKAAGGVDVQILGIGSDGHIGFNEPSGSLSSRTHVDFLTEQTRQDNARFFDGNLADVPTACITQGLGTIMEADKLVLIATGAGKAEAVAQMVEGPVSARWPATVVQFHNDITVLLDEDAASKLTMRDYYAQAWKAQYDQS